MVEIRRGTTRVSCDKALPKVSVIMPVYNAGVALRGSVASVLGQSYRDLELILVDDGSTDGSEKLCDNFAIEDDRVVVIHRPNGGVSSARNAGIAQASGDYLTFVDADDVLAPDALTKVVHRLSETGADLACFGMTFVYHDGSHVIARSVKAVEQDMVIAEPQALRDSFFPMFRLNYWSSVCNKLYRTSFVRDQAIRFDTRMAILEDFDFVVACITRLPTVAVMAEALYEYRIDLSVPSSSRRPSIDYLRSFRGLDDRLATFSAAVGFASPEEQGQLQAMVFRFYLIGLEMIFARRMTPSRRFSETQRYMSDERFVQAALGAGRSRRGVDVVALLVAGRRVLPVFLILLGWKWSKRTQRWLRVIASRARSALRR